MAWKKPKLSKPELYGQYWIRRTSGHTDPEPCLSGAVKLGEDLTRSQNRNVFFSERHRFFCPQHPTLMNYFFFPRRVMKPWAVPALGVSSVSWAVFSCGAAGLERRDGGAVAAQMPLARPTKCYLSQAAALSPLGCARHRVCVDCSFSPWARAPRQPHALSTQPPFQTLSR